MKKIISIFCISFLLLFCGCTEQSNNQINNGSNANSNNQITNDNTNMANQIPSKIKYFLVMNSENTTIFKFSFADNSGSIITPNNGNINLKIYDKYNELVYSKNYSLNNLKKDDYYIITLPSEKLKGFSKDGSAYITYSYNNIKLTSNNYIKLNVYTQEEMKKKFDEEYNKNAISVDKTQIRNDVQIHIIKYGWYKVYDNNTNTIKKVVRLDLEVKNLRKDELVFSPKNIHLTDGYNNYYLSDYGTLPDETKIGINSVKGGYWLFDKPSQLNNLKFTCTIDTNYVYDISLN
ncbi:hypothetical protein [Methanothermococcus okinawensis]|uniref:DUF4352 domain-containing protein n=1 Tax=Methanothermococcus okinawensis (strain DSM 14208 / JCM 11175 / IH1) TaxID=647113 RepID=F8AMF1_METOI|nr:hypothetical protein [Methanothermococcus okinawensis]AEH06848.1 hypothetical protein Metok_0875 [Methanothermococcus okinawensis IH1]